MLTGYWLEHGRYKAVDPECRTTCWIIASRTCPEGMWR